MTIEWKRKLSSRKLWLAFSLFVSGILSFWLSDEIVAKIVSAIMQGASVIGYIVGEGLVDAAHKGEEKPAQAENTCVETLRLVQGETEQPLPILRKTDDVRLFEAGDDDEEPVYNMEGEGL